MLQFSKLPDGGIVVAGEEARFTFTITNIGDVDAHQPQLIDELPGAGIIKWETDIAQDQNAACSFNVSQFVQTLVCDFDTLPPGQTAKAFVFGTTTTCPLTFNNSATVDRRLR